MQIFVAIIAWNYTVKSLDIDSSLESTSTKSDRLKERLGESMGKICMYNCTTLNVCWCFVIK